MFKWLKSKAKSILEAPFTIISRLVIKRALLTQYLVFGDKSRMKIAATAVVNNALFNVKSGEITIEDYVFFGHNVSILTGTHDYRKTGTERQKTIPKEGRDVTIKKGVWIASNVTIIGPCTIGENSVVGSCCLVHQDIPPNSICLAENHLTIKKITGKKLDTALLRERKQLHITRELLQATAK